MITYGGRTSGKERHKIPSTCSRPVEHWSKPPFGWVKLNVDGAWKEQEGTGGAGMILRDHTGAVIFASCRFIQRCTNALEAEMAALMEGVTLAI